MLCNQSVSNSSLERTHFRSIVRNNKKEKMVILQGYKRKGLLHHGHLPILSSLLTLPD